MAAIVKDKVLVVLQLNGGNDFMNTIVPYTSDLYRDVRPTVAIEEEDVLPIDDTLAFNSNAAPLKDLYDRGKVAVIQGIGYPNSERSHFRGMDIWHTCRPEELTTEGWGGKAVRELDPTHENVATGVHIGIGLPRAMTMPGVPVTSLNDLDSYGMMTPIEEQQKRERSLDTFKEMYGPAVGTGVVMDYLGQTGLDVLKGADMVAQAAASYSSEVEYADNPVSKSLRDVARIHLAGLGARIIYTADGGGGNGAYDVHANEVAAHPKLLTNMTRAVMDFYQDLRDHEASEEVLILMFTEFGRRVRDNGTGTDHGSGGGAFLIGDRVKGGLYSEYPPLQLDQLENNEDLKHTYDFRGLYSTVLEQWLGIEAAPIVGGTYEQLHPFD